MLPDLHNGIVAAPSCNGDFHWDWRASRCMCFSLRYTDELSNMYGY